MIFHESRSMNRPNRSKTLRRVMLGSLGLASVLFTSAPQAAKLGEDPIADVIAALSVEQKVGLVMGIGTSYPGMDPSRAPPLVGEAEMPVPGSAGSTASVRRLGIRSLRFADGPAGVRIDPTREAAPGETFHATAFPIASLLASSWDTELVERVGRTMGREARAYGIDVLLAPALNIHRNPLGGRNFEYFSEDPLVAGRMAAAIIRGIQLEGVGASPKHFVANNHEWNRYTIDVRVSQRALREIYLRGFEIAVRESAPWTIMSSYNKLNGAYTAERSDLLNGVLRDDWGFDGIVVTDWFAGASAAAQQNAGNDLLMPGTQVQRTELIEALKDGRLDERVLDRNLTRVLELVLHSNSMRGGRPSNFPKLMLNAPVAREAAAGGMVLLRNESALPLASNRRVAVFGNGGYRTLIGGTGSGDVNEAYAVSLLEGLSGAGYRVHEELAGEYQTYLAAAEATRPPPKRLRLPEPIPEMNLPRRLRGMVDEVDAALLVLSRNSGEFADRELEGDFRLTRDEQRMIAKVSDAFRRKDKPVVVVLNVGGVIETASWREDVDAILLAWQPGQEAGHAIADVLSGREPPTGKLATTFPLAWSDVPSSANFPGRALPVSDPEARGPQGTDPAAEVIYEDDIWVGYRHFVTREADVAYPFGYGLSYTRFAYEDLELSSDEFEGAIDVSVTVTNEGEASGREVVQLYLAAPGENKPARELRAFAKTRTLEPGESETLSFTLTGRDLASFDEAALAWVADAGGYRVQLGASSVDIRQEAEFQLGETKTIEAVSTRISATLRE